VKALDLFAGAGGWDVAATELGWDVDGVEIMPEARATRKAAGLATLLTDVRKVEGSERYEVVIASPPCQTFSQAGSGTGRRALEAVLSGVARYRTDHLSAPSYDELTSLTGDERTALILEPLRIVLAGLPRFVAWEQVPTVQPVWDACAVLLAERGYSVTTGILNAEQYGVPQTRRRAVLVARRDGQVARMPQPTHSRYHSRQPDRLDDGVLPWVSMADALGWGLLAQAIGEGRWAMRNGNQQHSAVRPVESPAPTIHFGARCNDVRWIQRSNYSDGGGPGRTAKERARTERELAEPSVTVTSKGFQWAEPGSSAGTRVTVEEAAILQTFPVGFPFQGGKGKRYQQVGNAVPPLLARAILTALVGTP
jgi:DNA (cytosine-5)-methyltransferase 1